MTFYRNTPTRRDLANAQRDYAITLSEFSDAEPCCFYDASPIGGTCCRCGIARTEGWYRFVDCMRRAGENNKTMETPDV